MSCGMSVSLQLTAGRGCPPWVHTPLGAVAPAVRPSLNPGPRGPLLTAPVPGRSTQESPHSSLAPSAPSTASRPTPGAQCGRASPRLAGSSPEGRPGGGRGRQRGPGTSQRESHPPGLEGEGGEGHREGLGQAWPSGGRRGVCCCRGGCGRPSYTTSLGCSEPPGLWVQLTGDRSHAGAHWAAPPRPAWAGVTSSPGSPSEGSLLEDGTSQPLRTRETGCWSAGPELEP